MISRLIHIAKGLLALVSIVAITVVVPMILLRQGVPFADAVDAFGDELTSDSKRIETVLIGGLTALGWAAWAMILVSLVNEVVARIRGRMPSRLPVVPGMQVLAQHLIGAVVLAVSVFGSAVPVAAGVAAPQPLVVLDQTPADPAPTSTPTGAATDHELEAKDTKPPAIGQVTRTHRVVAGDTLWDLAETLLGDATRWREIVDLNTGATMNDGETFSRHIRPDWDLQIPGPATAAAGEEATAVAGSSVIHTVETGDTLWDLSEDYLGTGEKYPDIAADNPDIADPNLIYPGQQLTVNDTTTTIAVTLNPRPDDAEQVPAAPSQPETEDPAVENRSAQPDGIEEQLPDEGGAIDDTAAAAESSPPGVETEWPTSTTASRIDRERVDETQVGESGSLIPVPAGLAVGGLVTAGVVAVVDRRRRAQRKNRERGCVVPPPPDRVEVAELALRAGAHVDRAHYLAAALRAAAAGSITGLPDLAWVCVDDDSVSLHLTEEVTMAPPQGWQTGYDGSWTTCQPYETLSDQATGRLDPLPTLCPVGTLSDGSEVLIDLEAAGIVTIRGDREGQAGLIRAMAMNATTSVWSTSPRILLAGFEGQIIEMPNVEPIALVTTGIEEAVTHATSTRDALRNVGCRSIVQARMSGATPDVWEPVMVLSAQPTGETHFQAAQGVLPTESLAAAVVTISDHHCGSGMELTVTDDGELRTDRLPSGVRASYLGDDDMIRLGEVLDHAAMPATTPAPDPMPARPTKTGAIENVSDASAPADVLASVMSDFDVIVRVMGDVTVEDTTGGEIKFERRKAQEAVVYMAAAAADGTVDIETLESRLWPAGDNSDRTRTNTLTLARSTLGVDRDGAQLLPKPTKGGRYEISPRATTDFELFWRLHELAEDTEDALAAARLLDQGVALVRGEPFIGTGRSYAWRATAAGEVVTRIVDAAYVAGEIFLAAGDAPATQRVCRAGLKASPTEECLYQLLMRASHLAGSAAGVSRLFRELEEVLADPDTGTEPEASISPETINLYQSLVTSA